MNRPRYIWIAFGACLLVVVSAMGWVSASTLRLERSESGAAQQFEIERLALWRMESTLVPLIARETARPHIEYSAFYDAEYAFPKSGKKFASGDIQVLSPLLTYESPYIVLHFQFDPAGRISSPQVPPSGMLKQIVPKFVTPERQTAMADRLAELKQKVTRNNLAATLSPEGPSQSIPAPLYAVDTDSNGAGVQDSPFAANSDNSQSAFGNRDDFPQSANAPAINLPQQTSQPPRQQSAIPQTNDLQNRRSYTEFQQRARNTYQSFQMANGIEMQVGITGKTSVKRGPMEAVWIGEMLLLARRTTFGGRNYIQGCLLDWPAIQQLLTLEVKDMLPDMKLLRVTSPSMLDRPLMLASLPVKLIPGRAIIEGLPVWTPMLLSLTIAWICVMLAATAVAALLWSTLRLSERRAAFVSAVTHELRTPLTTFRLYSEMLAKGLVTDESKRQTYYNTLQVEADRLGHLVENVLAYSRLERTKSHVIREDVVLDELFERLGGLLKRQAEDAGMKLEIQTPNNPPTVVCADEGAIERILVNLVDNACKYASGADDSRIQLTYSSRGKVGEIRVRDFGQGITPRNVKRLFRPFSKSAGEAAETASGVGLGLALCRQMARSMGGNLCVDTHVSKGACFVLTLPTKV